jgi:cell division inhibitor SepF
MDAHFIGSSYVGPSVRIAPVMGFSDLWSRTLVYFGIAEEEEWDENGYVTSEELEETYRRRDRQNVRRLPQAVEEEDWAAEEVAATRSRRRQDAREERPARLRSVDPGPPAKVHLVVPRSFNDAQQIADRFKAQIPVIINLQGADTDLSKRLIDFASGLTYALDGSMQRVADKVFLLTPRNVELSAEERARALERGGFYNQA